MIVGACNVCVVASRCAALDAFVCTSGNHGRHCLTVVRLSVTVPDAPFARDMQVLVNNAGITRDTLVMRMKPDQWQSVCEIVLKKVAATPSSNITGLHSWEIVSKMLWSIQRFLEAV